MNPANKGSESANKAAEIKEPKRAGGLKDTSQASLKEPDLSPAAAESSCNFSINYGRILYASPWQFASDLRNSSFQSLFLCLCIRIKTINSVRLLAFGDPSYFLFYKPTMFIAQLSTLNKPLVQPDPVLLFWNYLSILSSPFQALFYKRNLRFTSFPLCTCLLRAQYSKYPSS